MSEVGFTYTGRPPAELALAPPAARKAYWREAARQGLGLRRASLARGLGADGQPVRPISSRTRRSRARNVDPRTGRTPYSPMGRARPDAPPLQSTGSKSRTRAWLYARPEPTADRVWFGWRNDWGSILAMHRTGFYVTFADGRTAYVPPRDVIGLPPADVAALDAHMSRWWASNRAKFVVKTVTWINPERQVGNRAYAVGNMALTSGQTGDTTFGDASHTFRMTGERDKFFQVVPWKPKPKPPTPPQAAAYRVAPRPVPLLGVPQDGPLPDAIRERLPEELQGIETFGQLARTRSGRLWWAAVGLILFLELLRRAAA